MKKLIQCKKIGLEEHKCIVVSDPSHTYITSNNIVTHNSPMTSYSLAMCSATLSKSWDILGVPFEQFLEQSPYFEKVGRHDDIAAINKEDVECAKCYFTTAARGSSKMLFRNNLSLSLISNEGNLLGRAQPLYSKVMLTDGSYTTMGQVKVGDTIASPSTGSVDVVGVFPQGKRDIYEIELEDGRKVRASDNHLWKVAIDKTEVGDWNWRVVDTMQLIQWLKEGLDIEIYGEDVAKECHIPSQI